MPGARDSCSNIMGDVCGKKGHPGGPERQLEGGRVVFFVWFRSLVRGQLGSRDEVGVHTLVCAGSQAKLRQRWGVIWGEQGPQDRVIPKFGPHSVIFALV